MSVSYSPQSSPENIRPHPSPFWRGWFDYGAAFALGSCVVFWLIVGLAIYAAQ